MSAKQKTKKKKGVQAKADRQRINRELFHFSQTVEHGFPNKPSALAYDPILKLMAIGTQAGSVKVYGKPGVEFIGIHEHAKPVWKLCFLPGEGYMISILDDNTLHLWEISSNDNNSTLQETNNTHIEGRLKKLSVCCLSLDGSLLYLGTEGGNIYLLDTHTFQLSEKIILQDVVMQNVPDDYKVNPGAVEAICHHPKDPNKVLIGYNRGLIVVWDIAEVQVDATFVCNQELESLCWHHGGGQFTSSHSDGSYTIWNVSDTSSPAKDAVVPYAQEWLRGVKNAGVKFSRLFALRENGNNKTLAEITIYKADDTQFTKSHRDSSYIIMNVDETNAPFSDPIIPYGPFPCKAIPKLLALSSRNGSYLIFSGAMPRASFGDHYVVNVFQEDSQHVAFDFSSKVIDFFVINQGRPSDDFDDPQSLVILCEEELVCIDLSSDGWPCHQLPYLASLHASAIMSIHHVSSVPSDTYELLCRAGNEQAHGKYSHKDWPISGGVNMENPPEKRDLLLTGHEDGTVKFWDASTTALRYIYQLKTSALLKTDVDGSTDGDGEQEEEWPPFRKVGIFDPYSDDPRLGIQKITMCPYTNTLVVGGSAGQILYFTLGIQKTEREVETFNCRIVGDQEGFAWKGHGALETRTETLRLEPGFQAEFIVQAHPPAGITALAFQSQWGVTAFGTSHGFALIDSLQKKPIFSQCTLNPNDLSATGEAISRKKSFKKSLRASIRRLRKRKTPEEKRRHPEGGDVPPGERMVQARSSDETMISITRSLYFANTFVKDGHTSTPSLWVGTNAGIIYVFTLSVPTGENRTVGSVLAEIAKEIKLKHGAPVVSLMVIDGDAVPVPDPTAIEKGIARPPSPYGHQLIVCSEEQFKAFALPNLKPIRKAKLTAHDGSKARKVAFIDFRSKVDTSYSEPCLVCLTNLGELAIFTLPYLKKQFSFEAFNRANVAGIGSLLFTQKGEGFYLLSPSEFSRFSLSARYITEPQCSISVVESKPVPQPRTNVPAQQQNPVNGPVEPATNGDEEDQPEQTVDELCNEVDELLAKSGISMSFEGDTEENIELNNITVDEVREFDIQEHTGPEVVTYETEEVTLSIQKTTHTENTEQNGVEELEELQINE